MNLPPPSTFGLPEKYSQWRENQSQACESIADGPTRFLCQVCPTGFGKSVTYVTASQLQTGRTIILTSTKGLQTQLINDFKSVGMLDIRGRKNYPCRLNSQLTCDQGPCVFGVKCSMREEGGCFYFDQLKRAKRARVVVTNYSYWMSQNEFSDGLGAFELLILDEAHSAPDHVLDHVAVSFSKHSRMENTLLELDAGIPNDYTTWVSWVRERYLDVQDRLETAKTNRKEKQYIQLKRIFGKLERLYNTFDSSWLWEDNSHTVTLSPVWPAEFCESILFLGIPRIVLTSATVVRKTTHLLGIADEDLTYDEYQHTFPKASRPVIHIPTVRLNWKTTEMENRLWITRVDQIIAPRHGTKGIIHTVSYARRDMVMFRSRFSADMITHNSRDTEDVVKRFKREDPPCILVSPSMSTGWDFPDDECRWQIIIKLPYPDTTGTIMKERSKRDKDYSAYITMQQLIQATGRGVRNREDFCATFILDNNITWFMDRHKHLSVQWFNETFETRNTIPVVMGG